MKKKMPSRTVDRNAVRVAQAAGTERAGGFLLHNTYANVRLRGFGACIIIANHHRNGEMLENQVDEALSLDLC